MVLMITMIKSWKRMNNRTHWWPLYSWTTHRTWGRNIKRSRPTGYRCTVQDKIKHLTLYSFDRILNDLSGNTARRQKYTPGQSVPLFSCDKMFACFTCLRVYVQRGPAMSCRMCRVSSRRSITITSCQSVTSFPKVGFSLIYVDLLWSDVSCTGTQKRCRCSYFLRLFLARTTSGASTLSVVDMHIFGVQGTVHVAYPSVTRATFWCNKESASCI